MKSSDQLLRLVVRVSKEDSAFLYFTMEANEGLCFYSTLEESQGLPHRDVEIYLSTSLQNEVEKMLEHLASEIPLNILSKS